MRAKIAHLRSSKSALHAAVAALLVSCSALADDTEVFGAQVLATQKPNLLFVLDYSGSMRARPAGAPWGTDSRIEILKAAVRQVLGANEGKVNAGIGSLYSALPSGPLWPISDLEADANTIDPNIPMGTKTATDMISIQLDSRPAIGNTATVDALAEAAAYFRGDVVYNNGREQTYTEFHQPHSWDEAAQNYIGGSNVAPLPASYLPTDAYQPTGGTDGYGFCTNFQSGNSQEGINHCEGLVTFDCEQRRNYEASPIDSTVYRGSREVCKYERSDAWNGATYQSPITQECQINAIILVSDGIPSNQNNDEEIEKSIGTSLSDCEDLNHIFNSGSESLNRIGAKAGRCGPEILSTLANTPQIPGIQSSKVRTFTIGFGTEEDGSDYLAHLADAGNGGFFSASDPETLNTALSAIFNNLTSTGQSFAPLAIDVDRANFSHNNRAYFSLFAPKLNASWNGNLKGYFVDETGLIDINNNPATELNDGVRVMAESAQSFWSAISDGDDVATGGASERLASGVRDLLTYTGPNDIPNAGVNLSAIEHQLHIDNTQITPETLNVTEGRDTLLNWIHSAPMGDPLHSQPVQVSYDNAASDQDVIYIMTNQGFVHAVDATYPIEPDGSTAGGDEIFAFMPPELLPNLTKHYTNAPVRERIYGLDGALVRWHIDENHDGIVNGNDTITLVFGMRRGGNHYYALDVTDPRQPRYKWRIDGGSAEFPRLGETWSRPSLINVIDNGAEKQVLVFGGGYDADVLDGSIAPTTGALGNAIYMVDENGQKVLEVDGNYVFGMDYAIPSDLTTIDSNGDELVDRIYVGDLGGNLWRIDFDDLADGVTIEKLAELNDGGHRSFFYPPSVSLNATTGGNFLSIAIGSGNRTNPLRVESGDRLYMIRDKAVNTALPSDYQVVRTANLYNATDNDIGSSNKLVSSTAQEALNNAEGWYINLDENEKSLSSLVTFEGNILATSFDVNEKSLSDPCAPAGMNFFYTVDINTAEPVIPLGHTDNTELTVEDRRTRVNGNGILSQPTLIFPENGEITVLVDNEVVSSISQDLTRIFWYSK